MVLPLKHSILTPFDITIISKGIHMLQISIIHRFCTTLQNNLFSY